MREAGYTALSISEALGISVRTLHRLFSTHGTKRGTVKQELLDSVRAELINRVTSDETIREEVARLINDDLAHSRHLREILVSASEQLKATNLTEAVLVMRAAAAYSTALKNTSDVLRQTMRVDRPSVDPDGSLPELIITELTQQQVEALRDTHGEHSTLHG